LTAVLMVGVSGAICWGAQLTACVGYSLSASMLEWISYDANRVPEI
jgi:hypothetical protein